MSEAPWLTIVGLGEDGPEGLPSASRDAIARADVVMGPKRHLALIGAVAAETIEWPVPFSAGLATLQALAGRRVVVLASGDPFWFGAGAVIARHIPREAWICHPAPSTFALAAARLAWALEHCVCLGLHAAPLEEIRRHMTPGNRALVLLRDGAAVQDMATLLDRLGFGASTLWVMERLGGPQERVTQTTATALSGEFEHPVCLGINVAGSGAPLPRASGIADDFFDSDGVMTKRPLRAMTLSLLAPVPGAYLWDVGGGSGSIAIEWLLADRTCRATTIEPRADRAARIASNAASLGVAHLEIIEGSAPAALTGLDRPDAVFVGGGMTEDMLTWLFDRLGPGVRLVASAVTLESEALLTHWHAAKGGDLIRTEISRAKAMGSKRAWRATYPVVHWSVET